MVLQSRSSGLLHFLQEDRVCAAALLSRSAAPAIRPPPQGFRSEALKTVEMATLPPPGSGVSLCPKTRGLVKALRQHMHGAGQLRHALLG